jgi:8-oxo-dGTP pyrophosphatase MutT (NUDIX family)
MNPNAIGTDHLLQACKIGAARELFEETGMDLRSTIDRLVPIQVRQSSDDEGKLLCQFKKRIFFSVEVSEYDFFTKVCTQPLFYI